MIRSGPHLAWRIQRSNSASVMNETRRSGAARAVLHTGASKRGQSMAREHGTCVFFEVMLYQAAGVVA